MRRRLGREFFRRPAPVVARDLLGKRLVRVLQGERLGGAIVECEAYQGSADRASHAFRGKTRRNEVMFGEAGHAYVYFTYGNHWMLNLTVEPSGVPAAVLLRAVQPLEGVETMRKRRGVEREVDIASGPGKLAKALGVTGSLNGEDVVRSSELFVEDGRGPSEVGRSTRVGISFGDPNDWRFFVKGSPFVSRGRPSPRPPQNP